MTISTASQAYAIHLLEAKKTELNNELAKLKNNILNAVNINTKKSKIIALNKLITNFTNISQNSNEEPRVYYSRIINAFRQTDKKSYDILIQATVNPSRVQDLIENNLIDTDSPAYITERDNAITTINEKIKDLTKDKQTEKISGLQALINLLMDPTHFDKSVADVMQEYKTNHKNDYDKAVKAFLGSDTKTMLDTIGETYTSKPEQRSPIPTHN